MRSRNEHLKYLQDDLYRCRCSQHEDCYRILRRFIDERERDFFSLLHNGAAGRFDKLDGDRFEALIKRLYEGACIRRSLRAGRAIRAATSSSCAMMRRRSSKQSFAAT